MPKIVDRSHLTPHERELWERKKARERASYAARGEARRVYQREYRLANAEKLRARAMAYREANREELAVRQRQYTEVNKEVVNARQMERYYANHGERLKERAQFRRDNHELVLERARQYKGAHGDAIRARDRNRPKDLQKQRDYAKANKVRITWNRRRRNAEKRGLPIPSLPMPDD